VELLSSAGKMIKQKENGVEGREALSPWKILFICLLFVENSGLKGVVVNTEGGRKVKRFCFRGKLINWVPVVVARMYED